MRRRIAAALGAGVALPLVAARPALAHGLGGRVDLPVPRWLFVFGAATALVVSFVALSALWTTPRFEDADPPEGRWTAIQRLLTSRPLEWAIRLVSLAAFVVVTGAAALPRDPTETIGPVVVFVWFWVGLAFVSALFGDWWATLSPFDTIGRLLQLDYAEGRPPREYPAALGLWPATLFLFGFVWLELVDPFADRPGTLGFLIIGYTILTTVGMGLFGRRAWLEHGEAFGAYLHLLSRISPLARDGEGRVVWRVPLSGLATVPPRRGLVALVVVALGSTTFDGLSRTGWWVDSTAAFVGWERTLVYTLGLLSTCVIVAGIYAVAMMSAARVVGGEWQPLARTFAHSLVPIVLAYVVAHYFSFLLIEGQIGLARLSDPFGEGWDLFGTAGRRVNLTLVSPTVVWYVQVFAIVAGHIAGVIVAHDRAIARYERVRATRTQYALLGAMIAFTAGGLLILSG